MSLFVNTPDSDNQLVRSALRAWTVFWLTCSLHSVHCSLLPEQGKSFSFKSFSLLHFGTFIHGFALRNVFTHGRVWHHINWCLAHFNALWMEYIRSLRTGIMAEYPVMSTSQGTYVRIEQTSEVIRVTYKMCRVGGGKRGLELRTAGLENSWFRMFNFSAPRQGRTEMSVNVEEKCKISVSNSLRW